MLKSNFLSINRNVCLCVLICGDCKDIHLINCKSSNLRKYECVDRDIMNYTNLAELSHGK